MKRFMAVPLVRQRGSSGRRGGVVPPPASRSREHQHELSGALSSSCGVSVIMRRMFPKSMAQRVKKPRAGGSTPLGASVDLQDKVQMLVDRHPGVGSDDDGRLALLDDGGPRELGPR